MTRFRYAAAGSHATLSEQVADALRTGMLAASLPSPIMTSFLTVKEASRLTGKSASSIRRIIYPIIRNDAHADRAHIQPSVEEVLQLRMKGENFAWRLSEELLQREVPVEAASEKVPADSSARTYVQADAELLAMLRGELQIKNQQIAQTSELIAKQMELINGLSERLREGNVLIGSLQQRLALTDGRTPNQPVAVKTKRAPSPQAEKRSIIPPKPAKPKRGFLSRLFR